MPLQFTGGGVATFDQIVSNGTVTGQSFVGALVGNGTGTWNGPVTGTVTGNVIGGAALKIDSSLTQNLNAASGAITILVGLVYITNGSAGNYTIANPTVGTDDFKVLFIYSETAFAHVITQGTQGFDLKGASGTLTATAAKGASVAIMARNGLWEVLYTKNFTVA